MAAVEEAAKEALAEAEKAVIEATGFIDEAGSPAAPAPEAEQKEEESAVEAPAAEAPAVEAPAAEAPAAEAPATEAPAAEVPAAETPAAEAPAAETPAAETAAAEEAIPEAAEASAEKVAEAEAAFADPVSEVSAAVEDPPLEAEPAVVAAETAEEAAELEAVEVEAAEAAAPAEDGDITASGPDDEIQRVDVPDTEVDLDTTTLGRSELALAEAEEARKAAEATMHRLRSALEAVVAEFGPHTQSMPEGQMREALSEWTLRLESHVKELEDIMEETRVGSKEKTQDELDKVRSLRRTLECARTGRDEQDVDSPWFDEEETTKEIDELRRVRRQIRYIFGNMTLMGDTVMRDNDLPDDLISDRGEIDLPFKGAGLALLSNRKGMDHADAPRSNARADAANEAIQNGFSISKPSGERPARRPQSGGTELSSVTNSSAGLSWAPAAVLADDDTARRKEKKEKKERKERKHRREDREDAHATKKEDGAPPKQWNWAEEVVKASLDPRNQWQFPGASARGPTPQLQPGGLGREAPAWEQPRVRGNEIARQAWDRAEEVQRLELQAQREVERLSGAGQSSRSGPAAGLNPGYPSPRPFM